MTWPATSSAGAVAASMLALTAGVAAAVDNGSLPGPQVSGRVDLLDDCRTHYLITGAEPGPACYGRGGPLTGTDLNLLLG